jgi:hypothetical protein
MRDTSGHDMRAWIRHVLGQIDIARPQLDLDSNPSQLQGVLERAPWWSGCPRADAFLDRRDGDYRRVVLADAASHGYSALLLAWPPGYATPVHDHAGLWGLELVLDGVLAVEAFQLSDHEGLDLVHSQTTLLGIGDSTAFHGNTYAHRCSNRSRTALALSLHVYGGDLDAYRAFARESRGSWQSTPRRALHEVVKF